jgi:hypothetical protein
MFPFRKWNSIFTNKLAIMTLLMLILSFCVFYHLLSTLLLKPVADIEVIFLLCFRINTNEQKALLLSKFHFVKLNGTNDFCNFDHCPVFACKADIASVYCYL